MSRRACCPDTVQCEVERSGHGKGFSVDHGAVEELVVSSVVGAGDEHPRCVESNGLLAWSPQNVRQPSRGNVGSRHLAIRALVFVIAVVLSRTSYPDSWLPSLCCSEPEDSSDIELNSENSVQLRLCFPLSAARTSHRDSKYCTLSFNCVQVQTVPTAQVTPALTDFFS